MIYIIVNLVAMAYFLRTFDGFDNRETWADTTWIIFWLLGPFITAPIMCFGFLLGIIEGIRTAISEIKGRK